MYIRILTILILLFSFSSDSFAGLKMPSIKDKLPGGDKGGSSATIDFSSMKTGLTDAFFKSSDKFLEAQGYLFKAYKMDGAAKEIAALRKRAKDGKIDENERMNAVIKASAQNSEELKKIIEKESVTNAEQKAMYGKSFKPMGEGVKYAIQMAKEVKKMQESISEDKMNALKQLGGFVKVVKNLPGYISTVQSTAEMTMTGAKANDIEVSKKDAEAMGDEPD
jgi:hypothetical protein